MGLSAADLDENGLKIGISPEHFRAVAMPLLFDHLNAQCEGTVAVNRQARIVWMSDKYASKIGLADRRSALGREIEEVLPASRLREVVDSGQPSLLDLMPFGDEHFVVTRIPLRDDDGQVVGALGFVLFDRARHLKPLMEKYGRLQARLAEAERALLQARRARYTIANFIGTSAVATEIKRQARRAAQLDATVLLRVLQEQQVEPLGSNQVRPLDVRVIAATHVDLEARVAEGGFRADLFYRLNVLSLRVPALRERREDIRALVEALLDDIAARSGQRPLELADDALALLAEQAWPGNVRQLRNLLERAQLSAERGPLDGAALAALLGTAEPALAVPAAVASPRAVAPVASSEATPDTLPGERVVPLADSLARAERTALLAALRACGGNRRLAASRLGISRAGLYAKLQQHGIAR